MKRIRILTLALMASLPFSAASAHQWCWCVNQENTYGWQLMTPDERREHQARLIRFTEYDACIEYLESHRSKIDEKAGKAGIKVPAVTNNPCDTMKAQGILK